MSTHEETRFEAARPDHVHVLRFKPLFPLGVRASMSPIDRAGPVAEISPHSYFHVISFVKLCKNFDGPAQ